MKLGWVGVGKMGRPMASHLLAAGHEVVACDLVSALVQAVVAKGARAAPTPAAAAKGVHYLRVTVSGNNRMAEAKALTLIASGEPAVYERCRPLLALFGPQQYYVGAAEQARTLKLAINLMVYATVGGLAEALVMGSRGGLEWAQMLDVMAASAVGSPLLKNKSADLKKRDFSPTFSCLQARKDLALITGAAAASGMPAPLAQVLARMIEDCIANGSGEEDYAAMIKSVERGAK